MTPEEVRDMARFSLASLGPGDMELIADALELSAVGLRQMGEAFQTHRKGSVARVLWHRAKRCEELAVHFNSAVAR